MLTMADPLRGSLGPAPPEPEDRRQVIFSFCVGFRVYGLGFLLFFEGGGVLGFRVQDRRRTRGRRWLQNIRDPHVESQMSYYRTPKQPA